MRDAWVEVTLYKNIDPNQPVIFRSPKVDDAMRALRDWMNENRGITSTSPFGADGLTIFLEPYWGVDTAAVTLEWDQCYEGWSILDGHDLDDSFASWDEARDAFIQEVRCRGQIEWIDVS